MEKEIGKRAERWRERIDAHERSGLSVKQFCGPQEITEQSFYYWRKRLRLQEPVRFAFVETANVRPQVSTDPVVELVLTSGERLRIGTGVQAETLRTVLEALRA
jgi:hypothetical protein